MTHSCLTNEERAKRAALIEDLLSDGANLEMATFDTLIIGKKKTEGPGLLCLVDDDPIRGLSKGPTAFPMIDMLREKKTHCLIEGGVAPDYIIAQIRGFLQHDYRVMWITTQETHEIEWTNWAQPHEAWAVMVVLTREEGSA